MADINFEQIAKNIKKTREDKGISQSKLGNDCGIANTVISSYENNHSNPGLDTLAKIARALNVTIDSLVYGDENESFINTASSEGRKIVNCLYVLWELGVIYNFENYRQGVVDGSYKPKGFYLGIRVHEEPIRRLINSLNEFARKKETFSDPDAYLESILSSVANEIDIEIEEENERLQR